jgi:hypothetical protein
MRSRILGLDAERFAIASLAIALTGPALAQRPQAPLPPALTAPAPRDGARDFDFEIGAWRAHLTRRLRPLTGSTTWVDYDGSSVVRAVWGGTANLGELDVDGGGAHIQGLSLRTYNPATRLWSISWANAADGALTPPMVGGFQDGRGEFYGQDMLGGRPILARFLFLDIGPNGFRLEQAFSADDGRSWETNWISIFTR